MKKLTLILAFAVVVGYVVAAQETVYVSAKGNKDNMGWSEAESTTFQAALAQVIIGLTKKIIIIGALDINSGGIEMKDVAVFVIYDSETLDMRNTALGEIVITGKPNAAAAERAVLSAKGSGMRTVFVSKLNIRFEHIEISGGEGKNGVGLFINKDTQVTLGSGAVVRNNAGVGMIVRNGGTCIIDGGVVQNNNCGVFVEGILTLRDGSIRDNSSVGSGGGITIANGGYFTMSGGTITGNKTGTSKSYVGGGVFIAKGGRFTMTDGTITGNRAQDVTGGGVFVQSGGRFDQNGGSVSGNTAGQGSNPDVYRE